MAKSLTERHGTLHLIKLLSKLGEEFDRIENTASIICLCSKGLADNTVVAKVNGVLWDLDRPLEEDSSVELLNFDDEDGRLIAFVCLKIIFNPHF